eukprot:Clim_evm3s23 gene=Clim_evmTU3s23
MNEMHVVGSTEPLNGTPSMTSVRTTPARNNEDKGSFWKEQTTAYLITEGPKFFFLLLWFAANVALFFTTYDLYKANFAYRLTFSVLGDSLPVARGAAKVLVFNSAMILFPVCRNILSMARQRIKWRSIRTLLDFNLTFHMLSAWTIVIFSIVHTVAHFVNLRRIETNMNEQVGQVVDAGFDENRYEIFYTSIPTLTGVVLVIVIWLMATSSVETIRRTYFEVFWYTHHLFVLWYIGISVHGIQGFIRKFQNGELVNGEPTAWVWIIGPLGLYVCERILRFYRSNLRVEIVKVVQHPSRVLEIQMRRNRFTTEPGQYIFLNCPAISQYEWHPFTLTSCPEEDFFSVHIRVAGDWTEAIYKLFTENQNPENVPRLRVDGPFGTASDDVFKYRTSVLVGAGIGVTPFASILKSMFFQRLDPENKTIRTERVYFYWLCREKDAFEWFGDLLDALEEQAAECEMPNFIIYRIFLTGKLNHDEVQNIMLREDKSYDAITGLRQKTWFGRPDWDREFQSLKKNHTGKVGVFLCGPPILAQTLDQKAIKYTDTSVGGTRFFFSKENF